MNNLNNSQQITFTYLAEKGEFEMKIGDNIYASKDNRFFNMGDEFNDVLISELPAYLTFHLMSQDIDVNFYINKKGLVDAFISLSYRRKLWYGDIGLDNYLAAYQKMLLKYLSRGISRINKNTENDYCSISFAMKIKADYVIDVVNRVKELHEKIDGEISEAINNL